MLSQPPSSDGVDLDGKEPTVIRSVTNSVHESGHVDAGRLDEHLYDDTLQWWRAGIRRILVKSVEAESNIIASMQQRVRTPWLDTYFVYTSSLGTHTFFMIGIPIIFCFGYSDFGRGVLLSLALGVYFSSFTKDLICSPRPFVPPVTRLTFGSHHLEYGFPSTHSTNCISMALYVFAHMHRLYAEAAIGPTAYCFIVLGLITYAFSIVYGRIYTGMHSFTDCGFGVILGSGTWLLYHLAADPVDAWLATGSWIAPLVIIAVGLLMVNQHPQPVDDCPCFEDAIAFVSVGMGTLVGRWYAFANGYDSSFYVIIQSGSSFDSWTAVGIWSVFAIIKVVFAVTVIFTWRLVAKLLLHSTLPPLFRFLANIVTLPHRRFYTPATDYTTVPAGKGLHPIPSVIDLPSQLELETDREIPASTGRAAKRNVGVLLGQADVKNRKPGNGLNQGSVNEKGPSDKLAQFGQVGLDNEKDVDEPVKHYDADVLTKVVVYAGIGVLASDGIPIMIEMLGWGVRWS